MREKMSRFMSGRYGNDRFNQFLMILAMIFLVLSIVGPNFFYLFALIIMIYAYCRMFSRKTYQRAKENQWYLRQEMKVRDWFRRRKGAVARDKKEFAQRKTHRIYRCPGCGQKIRVPKGRGRIEIRCQKCGTKFIKRS